MGGDYSRQRFDPKRDPSATLMQQGRVQLDSDWNEFIEILDRRFRVETTDIIGKHVVPKETPNGFRIEVVGTTLTIGRGRIYVDGLLAENHGLLTENQGQGTLEFDPVLAEECGTLVAVPYDKQPYLPNTAEVAPAPEEGGPHLVYLDVWQREVTYLEDSYLVEKAVGVDTTTRLQTVWQVRVLPNVGPGAKCDTQLQGWNDRTAPSNGRLSTAAVGVPTTSDPCLLPPSGGYRGLENRLYRVEIHDAGQQATFKWSHDNASVGASVTVITALDKLTVSSMGRDSVTRFKVGDWVETIDDWLEFAQQPGVIRQIQKVESETQVITLTAPLPAAVFNTDAQGNTDPTRHTRVRRWDQSGEVRDTNGNLLINLNAPGSKGVIPVPPIGTSVVLQDGVQITFDTIAGGKYHVADYWTFAARTVDASVEELKQAPPRGIHHHFCRLALVTFPTTPTSSASVTNCRDFWPPAIEPASTDRGRHIERVLIGGQEIQNDNETLARFLAEGITVVCDQPVHQVSVTGLFGASGKPTCFVTLDLPYPFNGADRDLWGVPPRAVVGFQPLILMGRVNVQEKNIIWKPPDHVGEWLKGSLLQRVKQVTGFEKVLAHLTLKGNFIWDKENPELYLDGEAFATYTGTKLPSGDGRRGGDFEMYFWLYREGE